MTRLLACCLLLLSCLATQPATAQAVVKLLPGDCVDRPMMGVDSATYYATADYVTGAKVLLGVRAGRITELEHATQTADSMAAVAAAEVRRCRQQAEVSEAEFQALLTEARTLTGKPPAAPLLLDSHFYKGVGTGGVLATAALVLLKVFVFH